MPLAEKLISNNYNVKGTTTSDKKVKDLQKIGVKPYQIKLHLNSIEGDFKGFLGEINVLIIAIPPKIKQGGSQFFEALKYVFSNYDFTKLSKLIYVSSTGVFADGINKIYTENIKPNNSSSRGEQLISLEQLVLAQKQIKKTCILRYAGLIEDNGRHPINYLSGKTGISNPEAPVNLIERQDAVDLLFKIIEKDNILSIYHGVNPAHPSRQKYYTEKAKNLNLKPPKFNFSEESIGKIISSEITQKNLGFEYQKEI